MKIIYLVLLYFTTSAYAFTLMTNTAARFSGKEVKIYVTSNSTCSNAGISASDLLDIAMDGANDFWNNVPSSSLNIKRGGILETNDSLYLTGELCAKDSVNSCNPSTTIPIGSQIIIACNSNSTNFTSTVTYALTAPVDVSSSTISNSVILINDISGSTFSNLSYHERRSVLAHEIGHAIGLGHSNKSEALMYFKNRDRMNRLSQDDIDGITYLYPNKLDGCGSFFGMTLGDSNNNSNNTLGPGPKLFSSSLLGLGLFILFYLLTIKITTSSRSLFLFSRTQLRILQAK